MSIFWRPNGTVLDFEFAELSGSTVYDLSGNNNNGTINGATWIRGPLIGSLLFDGVDDYVEVPDNTSLRPSQVTIEILVYRPSELLTVEALIFSNRNLVVGRYGFSIYNAYNNLGFQTGDGSTWYNAQIDASNLVDMWLYIVAIHNGSENLLYINGDLKSQVPASLVYYSGTPLRIGCEPTSITRLLKGYVAFSRMYNRVISDSEIKAHNNYLLKYVPMRRISEEIMI